LKSPLAVSADLVLPGGPTGRHARQRRRARLAVSAASLALTSHALPTPITTLGRRRWGGFGAAARWTSCQGWSSPRSCLPRWSLRRRLGTAGGSSATPTCVGCASRARPGSTRRAFRARPGSTGRPSRAAPCSVGRPSGAAPCSAGPASRATPDSLERASKATPASAGRAPGPGRVRPGDRCGRRGVLWGDLPARCRLSAGQLPRPGQVRPGERDDSQVTAGC
jgi:hypothetical protein